MWKDKLELIEDKRCHCCKEIYVNEGVDIEVSDEEVYDKLNFLEKLIWPFMFKEEIEGEKTRISRKLRANWVYMFPVPGDKWICSNCCDNWNCIEYDYYISYGNKIHNEKKGTKMGDLYQKILVDSTKNFKKFCSFNTTQEKESLITEYRKIHQKRVEILFELQDYRPKKENSQSHRLLV